MKFGKNLGQTIKDIPSEWRPFVIQYKTLKKCIHKIVQELHDKGIPQDVLKLMHDATEGYMMEYSFEVDPIHIRPYIKFDLDTYENFPDIQLSHPLTEHTLKSLHTRCDSASVSSTDSSDTESTSSDPHDDFTTDIISTNTHLGSIDESHKMLYVELETDGEFFDTLLKEVSQLNHLQQKNKDGFVNRMNQFCEVLIDVTSPYKSDMYVWREIFRHYLQAEVFVGNTESDRNERSYIDAQEKFERLVELFKNKLLHKFKLSSSREAFHEFLKINDDLIAMKRFQCLNRTAMSKILKKHDKKTCLSASYNFEKLLDNVPYIITENMFKSLCFLMNNQLLKIVPQVDDHTCPICTFIYCKPIRLCCGHVFCVRCLIKAERKGIRNCPVCRSGDAVFKADASNLDKPLQNFVQLYFSKEVKSRQKELDKELFDEEMANLAQRQFGSGDPCCIM